MRWLRANLAEIHAYGGLALASVGVGLWTLAGGLLLAGVGLFYLAHRMPNQSEVEARERPRAVA